MSGDRTFGTRLRRLRLEAGLSQTAVERASGIPKTRLSRYENDHSLPSVGSLRRLAAALGTTEAALLGERTAGEDRLLQELRARGLAPRTIEDAYRLLERLDAARATG